MRSKAFPKFLEHGITSDRTIEIIEPHVKKPSMLESYLLLTWIQPCVMRLRELKQFEALNIRNSRVPNSLLWRSVSWRRNNVLVATSHWAPIKLQTSVVIFRSSGPWRAPTQKWDVSSHLRTVFSQPTARRHWDFCFSDFCLATHPWQHSLLPWFETWSGLLKKSMSSRVTHTQWLEIIQIC